MVLDEFDLRLERKRGLEVTRKINAEKSSCPGLIGSIISLFALRFSQSLGSR